MRLIQHTAQNVEFTTNTGRGLVDVICRYTQTFTLLQHHDEGLLTETVGTSKGALPSIIKVRQILASLKEDLQKRGEASRHGGYF